MHMNASAPEVGALLRFCDAHRAVVSTVIMRCGLLTCCREGTDDCGPATGPRRAGCTNDRAPQAGVVEGGVCPPPPPPPAGLARPPSPLH
jgi:hypothetical protein